MKVIEKPNDELHNPYWKFQLGQEAYEVKDTPRRVEVIQEVLRSHGRFEFVKAEHFPERLISHLHPYHDYIKNTSELLINEEDEFYPDLFLGEGDRLPRRVDEPLWGGIWCTDAVTPIKKMTYKVAKASADSALTGARYLRDEHERLVYALCRPSGHHAGPRVFGGYCYFNNMAVAAEYLLPSGPVAIVDIDYHHGNGTQEFFIEVKSVFTASIHGDPAIEYPYFWGYADEKGKGQAEGTNHNEPLVRGTEISAYLDALKRIVKSIQSFAPSWLIIGAGFDTHIDDPIGGFGLRTDDYTEIGAVLGALNLPTLVCQEGGYNTEVVGLCVRNFLIGLMKGEG